MTSTMPNRDYKVRFTRCPPPHAGDGVARYRYVRAEPHPTAHRIRSFADLNSGWHFGDGEAPSGETVTRALQLHQAALGFGLTHTDAFPGVDGEVQVTIYPSHDECYEFTISPDGTVHFIHEIGNTIALERENITIDSAIQQLRELVGRSWISSESSTSSITTPRGAGSLVSPSRTVPATEASRSLTPNAR